MRGTGGDVLYLDFDGVLHPDEVYRHVKSPHIRLHVPGHSLFENLPWLTHALEGFPSLKIVLSTSWVRSFDYHRARRRLRALRGRVIGATFHSLYMDAEVFQDIPRHQQILRDVHRRRPGRWLAVDDAVKDWPASLREHLFATESASGLLEEGTRVAFLQTLHARFP